MTVAMARGTALVATVARVVELTGQQDLANLETSGELNIDSATGMLVTASDAIYDQLESDGIDPTLITNETAFERSVAWFFIAMLVKLDYIPLPDSSEQFASPFDWSDPYYSKVRAKYATGTDESRVPNEGIPMVGGFYAGWKFGGRGGNSTNDRYSTWRPGKSESP